MERKRKKTKKAVVTVLMACAISSLTFSVSFADRNAAALLDEWYNKKAAIAVEQVDSAVKTELDIQKARLEEETKKIMEDTSIELDNHTDKEISSRKQAIIDYTDQLIADFKDSNKEAKQEAKAQIESKLDKILKSAQTAMDKLVESYTPPELEYEPPVVEEGAENKSHVEEPNENLKTQESENDPSEIEIRD